MNLDDRKKSYSDLIESISDTLYESVGSGGLEYEHKVYNSMVAAGVPGLDVGDVPGAGFSNQGAGDIEASYKGVPFNIEIKMSDRDQMGGFSFGYDSKTKQFTPSKDIDPGDMELIAAALKDKTKAIDDYINRARQIEPVEHHKKITGLPLTVSKEARDILKREGYMRKINDKVKLDASFIVKHYNKKGVYYINMGGAGLFYLGSNPLRLDVPPLRGEINVELRLGFSGSKRFFDTPEGRVDARSASMRVQGRLIGRGRSKYNLDDPKDVQQLFADK